MREILIFLAGMIIGAIVISIASASAYDKGFEDGRNANEKEEV